MATSLAGSVCSTGISTSLLVSTADAGTSTANAAGAMAGAAGSTTGAEDSTSVFVSAAAGTSGSVFATSGFVISVLATSVFAAACVTGTAGPILSASGAISSAAGIGPSSLAAKALSASNSSGVMSRGISGTSPGSCPGGAGAFTANTPLAPVLPFVLRKSRKVAPAAASSASGSVSSFFFFDGKRSRLFHPVSGSVLFSPPNRSTPGTEALKRVPSCCGTMRSSSRVIAVSNSLASNGFTM